MNKLDEFIQWLHEAMETTENWTPPKAETDSLRLYLETHLVGRTVLCIAVSVKDLDVVLVCLGPIAALVTRSLHQLTKPSFSGVKLNVCQPPYFKSMFQSSFQKGPCFKIA